jgi:hypothetical protein
LALQLEKDKRCFVCGVENPHSLKIKVEQDGPNQVKCEFMADDRYRGWSNYLHGGIFSDSQVGGALPQTGAPGQQADI